MLVPGWGLEFVGTVYETKTIFPLMSVNIKVNGRKIIAQEDVGDCHAMKGWKGT